MLNNYIEKYGIGKKSSLYVVLADYPGQDLIDNVNNNNYLTVYSNKIQKENKPNILLEELENNDFIEYGDNFIYFNKYNNYTTSSIVKLINNTINGIIPSHCLENIED